MSARSAFTDSPGQQQQDGQSLSGPHQRFGASFLPATFSLGFLHPFIKARSTSLQHSKSPRFMTRASEQSEVLPPGSPNHICTRKRTWSDRLKKKYEREKARHDLKTTWSSFQQHRGWIKGGFGKGGAGNLVVAKIALFVLLASFLNEGLCKSSWQPAWDYKTTLAEIQSMGNSWFAALLALLSF